MTIWLRESCATSFPPSLDGASAAAYFGTWLYSMESERTGAIPRRSSRMVRLSIQRPFLKKGLQDLRVARKTEMVDHRGSHIRERRVHEPII